jgi:hypothetical protein
MTSTGPRGGLQPSIRTNAPLTLMFSSEPAMGAAEPQASSTF